MILHTPPPSAPRSSRLRSTNVIASDGAIKHTRLAISDTRSCYFVPLTRYRPTDTEILRRKSFRLHLSLTPPLRTSTLSECSNAGVTSAQNRTTSRPRCAVKKFDTSSSRLDMIPACDIQTDRRITPSCKTCCQHTCVSKNDRIG